MAANEKRKAGKNGGSGMTRTPAYKGGGSKNTRKPVRTRKVPGSGK